MASTPEYNRQYYIKNRERVLARNKKWNSAHKDVIERIVKSWVKADPERAAENTRRWRSKGNNREKDRAGCRAYQKSHPEVFTAKNQKRRTAKTQAGGSFTAAEWKTLCKQYNYKCLDCGKRRKLTADHVVPVSKGGTSNIDNIQPLCSPCNSRKGAKCTDFRRT